MVIDVAAATLAGAHGISNVLQTSSIYDQNTIIKLYVLNFYIYYSVPAELPKSRASKGGPRLTTINSYMVFRSFHNSYFIASVTTALNEVAKNEGRCKDLGTH